MRMQALAHPPQCQIFRRSRSRVVIRGFTAGFLLPFCSLFGASVLNYDDPGNLAEVRTAVAGPPVITAQPQEVLVRPGDTATFTVALASRAGASFQWRKNGLSVGTRSDVLRLPAVGASDEASYDVVVSNGSGPVTSAVARLWLDSDLDGMPDAWEIEQFGSIGVNDGRGDADRDGVSDRDEYVDGTDPESATSRWFRLTLAAEGGSINGSPHSATGRYAPGTVVQLAPVPAAAHLFHEWHGDLTGSVVPGVLTMDAHRAVEAIFASPLGVALDSPELAWETTSVAPWARQTMVTHDGVDAARSGALAGPGRSVFSTYLEGRVLLRYWRKVSCGGNAALKVYLDGILVDSETGEQEWAQATISIPSGRHAVTWVYEKSAAAGSAGVDAAWLDQISVATAGGIALGEAVDAPAMEWTTGGAAPWLGDPANSHDGIDAAISAVIPDSDQSWIQTNLPRGFTLRYWWRVSSEPNADALTFQATGPALPSPITISGESGWQQRSDNLTPVDHQSTVRWTYRKEFYRSDGADAGWLDQVELVPIPQVPLSGALDSPALVWSTGGDAPWWAHNTSAAALGGAMAGSGRIGDNQQSWIETSVTGPAFVNFRWKSLCAPGDQFALLLDGGVVAQLNGPSSDWLRRELFVPPGSHSLRWRYQKDASGAGFGDVAWLDGVAVVPLLPLADAVEGAGLTFITGGNALWQGLASPGHDGIDAGRSDPLGNSAEAWLESQVAGPGTLGFWWKVSSQAGSDFLEFWVDGTRQSGRISGEVDWQQVVRTLGPGNHTVRWRYAKDANGSAGLDAGWIDQLVFTAENPPGLAGGFDAVAREFWSSGAAGPWVKDLADSHDGSDALRGTATAETSSWLESRIAGPATVAFWYKTSAAGRLRIDDDIGTGTVLNQTGWTRIQLALGAGLHTVRWTAELGVLWLDELEVTPDAPLALEVAVEGGGLAFGSGGDAPWAGSSLPNHDGTDAGNSGRLEHGQQSWFETTVSGPGTLGFWWMVSSEDGDFLELWVDGVLQGGRISGESGWQQVARTIPAGSHTVRWRYAKDSAGTQGLDIAWVDEISFTAASPPPLVDGADAAGAQWLSSGVSGPWSRVTIGAHDGSDALQSANVGAGGSSWLETTVEGPALVSFWSQALVLGTNAMLLVDGTIAATLAEPVWRRTEIDLFGGNHVLRWQANSGGLALDEVTVTPVSAPSLAAAVEGGGLSFSSGGTAAWVGRSLPSHDGIDAGRSGPVGHGQESWFETTMAGPGTLDFWWKVSSEAGADFMELWVDGVRQGGRISGEVDWQKVVQTIPAGSHTVRWRYAKNGSGVVGSDAGRVDEISFVPAAPPALVDALDDPARVYLSSGAAGVWDRSTADTHDGSDAAVSPDTGSGVESWLETVVTGPAIATFWTKVSSGGVGRVLIDGTGVISTSSATWTQLAFEIPAGSHRLGWTAALGVMRVDEFSVLPILPVPLADAVEGTGLTFLTGGGAGWSGNSVPNYDGSDAGRSGVIGHLQQTWLETTFTGPGTLGFWWKVSSQDSADYLELWVDGVLQPGRISGEVDWQQVVRTFGAGSHTVRWRYRKNGSVVAGSDAGWVDEISFISANPPALADAVDTPGRDFWSSGEGGVWTRDAVESHDGTDSARGSGAGTWLETAIDGPAFVSFWAKVAPGGSGLFMVDEGFAWSSSQVLTNNSWTLVQQEIGAGRHLVRWQSFSGTMWIDELQVRTIDLAEAVEGAGLAFVSGGDAAWFGRPEPSHDGMDAAASGALGHSQQSWLETTVAGPGTLSFWWKVSSFSGDDFLELWIDGVLQNGRISGAVDWQQVSRTLGTGSHTVRWRYAKGPAITAGADKGYVDEIAFVAQTPPALVAGLDDNGRHYLSSGAGGAWTRDDSDTHDGNDAVRSSSSGGSSESWLETTVAGPALLSFWYKVSGGGSAVLYLDGGLDETVTSTSWQRVERELAAGTHTVRWWASDGTMRLDELSVTPILSVPLAEALDAPALAFATGGAASWSGRSLPSHDGSDAVASGTIGHGQETWIETTVTGPGTLNFWWKVSSQAGDDFLEFQVNGEAQGGRISGTVDWQKVTRTLGSGTHTLRWRYTKGAAGSAGSDAAWIDEVSFTPQAPPALADGLDAAGLDFWSSGSAGPWTFTGVATHDGSDAINSAVVAPVGSSWIETRVTGPAWLSFHAKVSVGGTGRLLLNGAPLQSYVFSAWNPFEIDLPAGPHTLRWESTQGTLALDGLVVQPANPLALAEAVDAAPLVVTTGGDAPWTGRTAPSHDGTDAGRSGAIGASQETWMETTVSGPGELRFWWRHSADFGDALELWVDGSYATAIIGLTSWEEVSWLLGPGNHTVRWRYAKDSAGSAGLDAGFVDEIRYVPILPVTLATALDAPALVFTTGGDAPWAGRSAPSHDGTDAAASGMIADNQQSWLETTLSGPGTLGFWWKVSSDFDDFLELWVDGVLQSGRLTSSFGGSGWQRVEKTLGTGNHTVRWRYAKGFFGSGGSDAAWVDEVSFTAGSPTDLANGTDQPGMEFLTTGEAGPWSRDTGESHDGNDSVRSGAVGMGSFNSWLETTVQGPSTVSFWAKVSAGGSAEVQVNEGVDGFFTLNSAGWTRVRLEVTPIGPVKLRWAVFDGILWVDELSVTSAAAETFDQWRARVFTAAELADPLVSGFAADPNRNGVSNALEAVFGADPMGGGGPEGLAVRRESTGDAARLSFDFTFAAAPPTDLTCEVQVSNQLSGAWTTIARKAGDGAWTGVAEVSVDAAPGGRVRVNVRDTQTSSGTPRRFGRLAVISP